MSGKSQELIQKLIQAENEAETIIKRAREARSTKLKNVKAAAEEELAPFKAKEDQRFQEEQRALASKASVSADLEKSTQQELNMVKNDYESNKKNGIKFILDKVLDIDLSIPLNVKQQLISA